MGRRFAQLVANEAPPHVAAFLHKVFASRVLIRYYSVVTMVNVTYGTIAITVVALISVQVAAIILSLGTR
ncbi:hypothetical protein [Oryzomonas rubra]|uniref:Uncharacterized protein n=1 Tax=Oryzomonas rubra TaxID=2509454 RepID=A0A5A9XBJ7_9BACT|nr:hypothetical protein [Oryzomonas rubra]KAA0890366.1 hypothetical protein ET418_11910 [Oryzomonas rubra]